MEPIDYPQMIADNAMPANTCYNYISSCFLDGIINYLNTYDALYLVHTYAKSPTDKEAILQSAREKYADQYHPKFLKLHEECNVMVFGTTDLSYWLFWYDQDVSDCTVARGLRTSYQSLDDFISQFLSWVDQNRLIKTDFLPSNKSRKGWLAG